MHKQNYPDSFDDFQVCAFEWESGHVYFCKLFKFCDNRPNSCEFETVKSANLKVVK